MKKLMISLVFLLTKYSLTAQNTTIGQGFVLPQMTTLDRLDLNSPNGTLVFDTQTQSYWCKQNGKWTELPKTTNAVNRWELQGTGNAIRNMGTGGFWSAYPTPSDPEGKAGKYPYPIPLNEVGTRLMWIPNQSAFRVGTVRNTSCWSFENIGSFSFASGLDTRASNAAAIGTEAVAAGFTATALGEHTVADGYYSVALGSDTQSFGDGSVTFGVGCRTLDNYAVAIGSYAKATVSHATAMGTYAIASGVYSTAIGRYVDTNRQAGAFIMGDSSPHNPGGGGSGTTGTTVGIADEFVGRFNGGYRLITTGGENPLGAQMLNGESGWSIISDSTRKEKFIAANGELFLQKLGSLRLGSWNYKKQGNTPRRYYGPMAQEIYAAYGHDKWGIIGTDTTVSSQNADGLLFILAQALEAQTAQMQKENQLLEAQLEAENLTLKNIILQMNTRLAVLEAGTTARLPVRNILLPTERKLP
ncbi:tail fiber domain-containing protein [Emticicia agri]|uniref:Peptidase S74 domain-containing protein n=1 Tax=Emticicia agri TaxID=2492393 RepID=A0A4V1ZCH1_9BACT|nr:tail fiber domain-containing protein [Emticicia agri]RYU92640.1 hypothetical protein EWM59_26160 [Emticicia agri]